MRIGIYPGSFDPLTYGHLDIIERASRLCDTLIVAIAKNSAKKPFFSVEERIDLLRNTLEGPGNVEIVAFEGLLADYCLSRGVNFIVRGVRSITDLEYETPIAAINRKLAPGIETIFLLAREEHSFVASAIVREIAAYRGDLGSLVPPYVAEKILQRQNNH